MSGPYLIAPEFSEASALEEVMIERCRHICLNPSLEGNFKRLLIAGDSRLLQNPGLRFIVDDEMDCIRKLDSFVQSIATIEDVSGGPQEAGREESKTDDYVESR